MSCSISAQQQTVSKGAQITSMMRASSGTVGVSQAQRTAGSKAPARLLLLQVYCQLLVLLLLGYLWGFSWLQH